MKTLDERILQNMQAELNICKLKRSVLVEGGLVPSILTKRIEVLTEAINTVKREMIEAAIREAQK